MRSPGCVEINSKVTFLDTSIILSKSFKSLINTGLTAKCYCKDFTVDSFGLTAMTGQLGLQLLIFLAV